MLRLPKVARKFLANILNRFRAELSRFVEAQAARRQVNIHIASRRMWL
jgi:hypothetical protein